jgi:hypothetical protein
MATKATKKVLILGGDPNAEFVTPKDDEFGEDEYVESPGLQKIGEALIEQRLCFESLRDIPIAFLWKRKATEKPRKLLGKCQRPSGLLAYFSRFYFVVWLAANNCQGMTNWQIEALVFHELKHAFVEDGEPVSIPHDWEGFAEEIQRYGLWKQDIVPIAEALTKQMEIRFPEHKPAMQHAREQLEREFGPILPIPDGQVPPPATGAETPPSPA